MEHVLNDESNLPIIDDPRLKAIPEYGNHPNILRIKNYMNEKRCTFF